MSKIRFSDCQLYHTIKVYYMQKLLVIIPCVSPKYEAVPVSYQHKPHIVIGCEMMSVLVRVSLTAPFFTQTPALLQQVENKASHLPQYSPKSFEIDLPLPLAGFKMC